MQNNHPDQEEKLPSYDNPFIFQINDEDENGSFDSDEEQRRLEEEEQRWHEEEI